MSNRHVADPATSAGWYHTIDLPTGATAGEYDLRRVVRRLPLPTSLAGKRCLDVGTHDGYWAFHMEKLGAAEVVGIDIEDPEQIDWPEPRPELSEADRSVLSARKAKFFIAREALNSKVQHEYISVYDISASGIGEFDFVHVGSILQHLRDPVGALMALRDVVRGEIFVNATVSISKSVLFPRSAVANLSTAFDHPFWQIPNIAGLRAQVTSAGFQLTRHGPLYFQPRGSGMPHSPVTFDIRQPTGWAHELVRRRRVAHYCLLARPAGR
jgi:tRNA (mo5U34)-methyltransferase